VPIIFTRIVYPGYNYTPSEQDGVLKKMHRGGAQGRPVPIAGVQCPSVSSVGARYRPIVYLDARM